jgi:2-keto-3-deoxy-6-phosphogluconate aldolase
MMTASVSNVSSVPTLSEALRACPLIAILRWIGPDEVESVGDVLIEAGFRLIEVPLNSPEPYTSIERLARRFRPTVLQTPFGGSTVASSRFISKGAHHAPCRSTFIPPCVWASGYSSITRRAS